MKTASTNIPRVVKLGNPTIVSKHAKNPEPELDKEAQTQSKLHLKSPRVVLPNGAINWVTKPP